MLVVEIDFVRALVDNKWISSFYREYYLYLITFARTPERMFIIPVDEITEQTVSE